MSGKLYLVSVGPGLPQFAVGRAAEAIAACDAIVGYELYFTWIKPWLAGKELITAPLTQEIERARLAIELARQGRQVALISSGDIGIYAMASPAFELMSEDDTFAVEVVPGVTAACAGAALLGAPLSHDFATLSLSDLLCPFAWIEERASHLAAADMVVALYNVQSKQRQEGIYRILRLMLEHKSPGTICGVVRNACRPDQSVHVAQLSELLDQKFDMFTTIIIGNKYTRRKREWIFTPRGYLGWSAMSENAREPAARSGAASTGAMSPPPPQQAVWVFSGTGDGNQLACLISRLGLPVVVSAATAYGQNLASAACPDVCVIAGKMGTEARKQALSDYRARAIVDATHPFAGDISRQLMALCRSLDIAYIRYERPALPPVPEAIICDSAEEAARRAIALGRRIFLSTGSKELASFLQAAESDRREWFVRIAPEANFLEHALELGIPPANICAMQGPFTEALNEALLRQWHIDCVVAKDSGQAGGFMEKANVSRRLGIPFIVLRRPAISYPCLATSFDSVLAFVQNTGASG